MRPVTKAEPAKGHRAASEPALDEHGDPIPF